MTQRDNILQELKELESSLSTASFSNVYRIPGNYFEELAGLIMARIRAMEPESSHDELVSFSSLPDLDRLTPYQVPVGYFDGLEDRLMKGVLQSELNLEPAEELETLSPLLSSLKKEVPYSIPENYFSTLNNRVEEAAPAKAKVVSFVNRKWFRYAAAAMVTGFIALGGFLYKGSNERIDPIAKSHEWVEKNIKKVSTDDLNNFINQADEGAPVLASTSNPEDVKELMKNVSDKAIQDFLNDAQVGEPDSNDPQALN